MYTVRLHTCLHKPFWELKYKGRPVYRYWRIKPRAYAWSRNRFMGCHRTPVFMSLFIPYSVIPRKTKGGQR